MISTNILKSLESNFQDPSYSVVISKFEQPEFCNKDRLKIYMQQFSPNFESIIENNLKVIDELKSLLTSNNIEIPDYLSNPSDINNCVQKTLTIDSMLDYDASDGLYVSKLNGSIEDDLELNKRSSSLKWKISDRKVVLTELDSPNYFNRSRFRIKNNNLIIDIPKKIESFNLRVDKICTNEKCYDDNNEEIQNCENQVQMLTEQNAINNQLIIPLNLCLYSYSFSMSYTIKESVLNHNIESVVTPLKSKIEIDFVNTYSIVPAVILTIDEDDKVYSSYTTTFTTDINNSYNGVIIEFKGLKKQKKYGDINITIFGSEKKQAESVESNDTPGNNDNPTNNDEPTNNDDPGAPIVDTTHPINVGPGAQHP